MAQANKTTSEQPALSLNHIAMYVYDLKRSAYFYEKILQLKQIQEPFKDGKHVWFSLGANSQLHLISGASQGMVYDKHEHLCFSVRSMEGLISRLDKYGVDRENMKGDSKEPNTRPDGIKQIYFKDPDGHWIEVNDDYVGRPKK